MIDKSYAARIVERLAAIENRGAGLEGERQAAKLVHEELETMGWTARVQQFRGPRRLGGPAAAVLALGCGGLLLGFSHPLWGALAVAVALGLLLKLADFRKPAPDWLPGSDLSQNVVSARERDQAAVNIVLSAHLDTGQAGLLFHPFFKRLFGRINSRAPQPRGPLFLPAAALAAGLAALIFRDCGATGWLPGLLQWSAIVVSAVAAAVCLQWSLAPHVPGAIDNASGVAALLCAAAELTADELQRSNVYLAATGAEEAGLLGMRAFCAQQRELIGRRPTYFINFESIGGGELVCVASEGLIGTLHYAPELNGLAQHVAREQGLSKLRAVQLMAITDSAVPVSLGHPALCLIALDELGMPPNYHQMSDTAQGVDFALIEQAARLACAVCRELDKRA